jgi:hypothetical protein
MRLCSYIHLLFLRLAKTMSGPTTVEDLGAVTWCRSDRSTPCRECPDVGHLSVSSMSALILESNITSTSAISRMTTIKPGRFENSRSTCGLNDHPAVILLSVCNCDKHSLSTSTPTFHFDIKSDQLLHSHQECSALLFGTPSNLIFGSGTAR